MNATLKLGEHFIFDLSDCNHEILMDGERAYSLFAQAVREGGLTVVDEGFYKFSPHGFTCFLLLAESHASLHAWPEYDYCAIDLFTCAIGKDALDAHALTVVGVQFFCKPDAHKRSNPLG